MNALKMKSFKSVILYVLLLWIIAVVFGVAAFPGLVNSTKEPIALEEVNFSGDIEGLYVTGTIYGIYDYYCEETEDNVVISREYLTDAGDNYYIALRAEGDDMTDANTLMDATYAYFMGEDDGSLLAANQYEITGIIKKMPTDSLQFYHEYIEWDSLDAESQSNFLPYYIDINKLGNYDAQGTMIMAVAGGVMFLIGVVFLILTFTGFFQKPVKKYIQNSSNPKLAAEKVNNFVQTVPEVNGLRYNHEFICGSNKYLITFGETPKIVWIYKQVVNHKRYFITVSKSYTVVTGFIDGTKQISFVKNESSADSHIEQLQQLCPQAVIGYTNELDRMFRKDLNQFLNISYNAPESEKHTTDY